MTTAHRTSLGADPFRMTLLVFAIIAFMYFTGEVLKPLAVGNGRINCMKQSAN